MNMQRSHKVSNHIVLIILMLFGFSNYAFASDEIFCIKDVEIYSESDTLDNARREAINAGTESAFKTLLARLLPEDALWKVATLKKNNAYDSLLDTNVTYERMTSSSYRAKVDFIFNPKKTKTILNRMGIYYTDSYSPQYLIIPILVDGSNCDIWDNPSWFVAWEGLANTFGLLRLNYLLGDLIDEALIDPALYKKGEFKNLDRLLKRYHSDEAYLVIAEKKGDKYDVVIENISRRSKSYTISLKAQPELSNEAFFKTIANAVLIKMDAIYKYFDSM